jgi:hypothetical protein
VVFRRLGLVIVVLALALMPLNAWADSSVLSPPSDAEKVVLAQLFALNRTAEGLRTTISSFDDRIASLVLQSQAFQIERDRLEAQRLTRKAQYEVRVRYTYEQGPLTPIAFLFSSKTFPEFLSRLDSLMWLLKQDSRLLASLRDLKLTVEGQDRAIAAQRTALVSLRDEQVGAVNRLQSEIAGKEAILVALKEQRGGIEAQLNELEVRWNRDAKPVLDHLGESLKSLSDRLGEFHPDAVDFTLVPPGATVRITDRTLNQFFAKVSDLQGLNFVMVPDQVILAGEFGGTKLRIEGRFRVAGKTVLQYEPTSIYVQELKAPTSVTNALVASGKLDIDLGTILNPWKLQSVTIKPGEMVLKAGAQ